MLSYFHALYTSLRPKPIASLPIIKSLLWMAPYRIEKLNQETSTGIILVWVALMCRWMKLSLPKRDRLSRSNLQPNLLALPHDGGCRCLLCGYLGAVTP
jgi:hypothetical protein